MVGPSGVLPNLSPKVRAYNPFPDIASEVEVTGESLELHLFQTTGVYHSFTK